MSTYLTIWPPVVGLGWAKGVGVKYGANQYFDHTHLFDFYFTLKAYLAPFWPQNTMRNTADDIQTVDMQVTRCFKAETRFNFRLISLNVMVDVDVLRYPPPPPSRNVFRKLLALPTSKFTTT